MIKIRKWLPILLPTLAVIGALNQCTPLLIGVLGSIPFFAFGPWRPAKPWNYRILIYCIASALLLSTTLISSQLTGSDIHLEMFYANRALTQGWDSSLPNALNGALSITIFLPHVAKVTGIDLIIIFKLVPLLLALVPVILWDTFRTFLNDRKAYLSVFFFIVFPVFVLEMTGMARGQIGEVFFALTLYFAIANKWSFKYKLLAILGCIILTLMSHYSLGIVLIGLLCIVLIVLIIKKRWHEAKLIGLATGIALIVGYIYFNWVASGQIAYSIDFLLESQKAMLGLGATPATPDTTGSPSSFIPMTSPFTKLISRGQLIVPALGLDFSQVSNFGKAYRVLQWLIYGSAFIGLIRTYKDKTLNCLRPYIWGAIVILGVCVIVPGFSTILNLSRFIHICLFILSPLLIIGATHIVKREYLVLGILIPYAFLSSGIPFEALKTTDSSIADVPYSIALSNKTADVGGCLTHNDASVANWAYEHDIMVYSDIHSNILLQERYGVSDKLIVLPEITYVSDEGVAYLKDWSDKELMMIERKKPITDEMRKHLKEWLATTSLTIVGQPKILTDNCTIFTKFWLPTGEKVTIGEGTPISDNPSEFLKPWTNESIVVVYSVEKVLSDSYIFLREWNNETQTLAFWGGPGIRKNVTYSDLGMAQLLVGRDITYQKGGAILYGPKKY